MGSTISILGGHKLALSYFEKLRAARGTLGYDALTCVTADAESPAVRTLKPEEIVLKAPFGFIIEDILQDADPADKFLVPDHTARHVFLEAALSWLSRNGRQPVLTKYQPPFSTPFVYQSEGDAIWALSHATWSCPPDCDEPATCPHIQKERDWDFNRSFAELEKNGGLGDKIVLRFECQPLYKEIACIPYASIQENFRKLEKQAGSFDMLVITHSHCHGILGHVRVT